MILDCTSLRLSDELQCVAADPFGGQVNGKFCPLTGSAVHIDGAAVRFDDPRHETQAQTETLLGRRGGALARHAIEAIEDMRQMLRCDAASRVFDTEARATRLGTDGQPHLTP